MGWPFRAPGSAIALQRCMPSQPARGEIEDRGIRVKAASFGRSSDPSFLDRRRLDSDVRYFLRSPSMPWIVYDRDSRASGLPTADGVVWEDDSVVTSVPPVKRTKPAPRSAPPAAEPAPLDPPTITVSSISFPELSLAPLVPPRLVDMGDAPSNVELLHVEEDPSSIAIAADVRSRIAASDSKASRSRRRPLLIAGAITCALAAAAAAFIVHSAPPVAKPVDTRSVAATTGDAPAVQAKVEAPAPLKNVVPTPAAAHVADAARTKVGRLAIGTASASRRVYFDGKLLLGTGARSFDVRCGAHTISFDKRNDPRPFDVPCGGKVDVDGLR